ncbi:MAG: S9 family peptidase [Flavobacteriales bacterium]|nr:S9 family peptidase [Flavobacteriales bacterium]
MRFSFIGIVAISAFLVSCEANETNSIETTNSDMTPPVAKKVAEEFTIHGDTRTDNYFWMRLTDEQKEAETPDAQTQDVLDYLNAENDYSKAMMRHTEAFQDKLFNEIKSRIKEDDQSVPVSANGYSYYRRYEVGADYPLYCRKKLEDGAKEEIMLNGPEMGEGKSYFAIGDYSVSEDNKLLAYSVDYVSRREYAISVKNLETGEILEDNIPDTDGGVTWANDNQTLFYTKQDPVTLRSYQIYKHKLGTPSSEDVLVYEETDETFGTFIYKTKSRKYLIIGSYQTMSNEYQFLDASTPDGEWKMIQPRERGLEYGVDHYGDSFYITTNQDAKNFKLVKAPVADPGKENWEDLIAHRPNVLFEGIDIFKDYLVVTERDKGLRKLRIMPWDGRDEHYIEFNDPTYRVSTSSNPEFDTQIVRYNYMSMTTPNSTIDYNMTTKEETVLKQQEVLGGKFSPDNYQSERLMATARDGKQVPISIVYKKGVEKNGQAPLLLYSYGSYGSTLDPWFSSVRLSLLDRGFVFALAHIRGGQDLGREWYEDGKLLNKKNTFTDFIDCGKYLIEKNYTSSEHLYAQGGSAGGLLMGAVVNMAPDLWNGVIAQVPFVDVINTMLDESIPLTTGEFDEWGNPKDSIYYDYIKSYSPYDNVEAKDYPNMLVTTGYWDSQVQYWEPAKWVALLRELKTDENMLIMDCNMEVGHGGASGRFDSYKETAMEYAFLFNLEGITE